MYALGRFFGEAFFKMALFRKVFTPARQAKIHHFYTGHGKKTIFIVRFMPGLRSGVYVLAGALRMGWLRFFLADFLAAILSIPLFVGLGYFLAPHIEEVAKSIGRAKTWLIILAAIVILVIIVYRNVIKRTAQTYLLPHQAKSTNPEPNPKACTVQTDDITHNQPTNK